MVASNRKASLKGVILDLDGVLWVSGEPADYARQLVDWLRLTQVPFIVLTNDCSLSKAERLGAMKRMGLSLHHNELLMAAELANEWLIQQQIRTITYLGSKSVLPEVASGLYVRNDEFVDAVVVGDMFRSFDMELLSIASRAVTNGAALVAMNRNSHWSDGNSWFIDNGFWVAGLEYVTNSESVLTGKPSSHAYLFTIQKIGLEKAHRSEIAFISDNADIDLKGAREVGLKTIYLGRDKDVPLWVDARVATLEQLRFLLAGWMR